MNLSGKNIRIKSETKHAYGNAGNVGSCFIRTKDLNQLPIFCCVDCSNKYWEKEQKQGIRHCRYCSTPYKPSVSTYGNVYKLCCPDCTAIVTKINYKLVDWQKEKFKNGRFYKKKVRESKI